MSSFFFILCTYYTCIGKKRKSIDRRIYIPTGNNNKIIEKEKIKIKDFIKPKK